MKIQIVKEGSIQGWFVSFLITITSICAFAVSMIWDSFADRFTKVGGIWATIAITQFSAWLAYRVFKKDGGCPPVQP